MRPRVELIYDRDCPNLPAAREALRRGFAEAGLRPGWVEWERQSPASPPHAARYGSPTILVGGIDVGGEDSAAGAAACRLYDHGSAGLQGVPPVALITRALRSAGPVPAGSAGPGGGWWRSLAALPGAGAALLPVGLCPACWPAYGGLLGSLGLGFLLEGSFLLPLTAGLLGLSLVPLGFRARRRRGYLPLVLGSISAAAILAFKFRHPSVPLADAGLAGLVAASAWNAWPRRPRPAASCPGCAGGERSRGSTAT